MPKTKEPNKLIIGPNLLDSFLAKCRPISVVENAQIPIEKINGMIGLLEIPRPIPTPKASRLVASETIKILVKL